MTDQFDTSRNNKTTPPVDASDPLKESGSDLRKGRLPSPQHFDDGRPFGSAAYFPMEEALTKGITAKLLAPGVDLRILKDCLKLIEAAFDEEIKIRSEETYTQLCNGQIVRLMDDPASTDYGQHFEATGFFVYYQKERPIGISGLYRYLEEPTEFWLGLIGVDPDLQNQGFGKILVNHILSLTAKMGGQTLKAFTSDAAENAPVHAFYEKLGFKLKPGTIMEWGEPQRIYERSTIS